jgi:GntR family transcriptional repressor for pyruvate dehydrogenase complex
MLMLPPSRRLKSGIAIETHERLYKGLAQRLIDDLTVGKYPVGSRLPAERELATAYAVSRPTVREAVIALEVQGLVEVRIGSGAHVKRLPGAEDMPEYHATAFEITEARLLIEGEAAALAATQITEDELQDLDRLVQRIAEENDRDHGKEDADQEFHLLIARATRNTALARSVEELWRLRTTSPESTLLFAKARSAHIKPVVEEHCLIAQALRLRDPDAARAAMRAHLGAVLEYLLFATEERAVAEARRAAQSTRERFARSVAL